MSDTSVSTDFLQSFQVLSEFVIESVGEELGVFPVDNVLLSVEEPFWDFVLSGVLDDGDDSLEFFGGEFTSPGISKDPRRARSPHKREG